MSDSGCRAEAGLPAHVQLIQMCAGAWVAAAVYGAAKIGLADHLADGGRSGAISWTFRSLAGEFSSFRRQGRLQKAALISHTVLPSTRATAIRLSRAVASRRTGPRVPVVGYR
jgi:hypothetical protein